MEDIIDYDATTIEEAKRYLQYRYKQLGKFGITVEEEIVVDDNSIVTLYNTPFEGNSWGSIYILEQFRGQQLFIKRLQQFMIAIVTLEECDIARYLESIKCRHVVLTHSPAYKLIQSHYGSRTTQRSGVALVNHIEEGGTILEHMGASDIVKDAYYLHPLLQGDDGMRENKSLDFSGISTESIILAMEYRQVANSYLSTNIMENFMGFTCEEVKQMLIADKVQNYKDFIKYHWITHERSDELYDYFHNWFHLLRIDHEDYLKLIS